MHHRSCERALDLSARVAVVPHRFGTREGRSREAGRRLGAGLGREERVVGGIRVEREGPEDARGVLGKVVGLVSGASGGRRVALPVRGGRGGERGLDVLVGSVGVPVGGDIVRGSGVTCKSAVVVVRGRVGHRVGREAASTKGRRTLLHVHAS